MNFIFVIIVPTTIRQRVNKMKYSVKNLSGKGEFSVPNLIVDKHLRLAGGEQIKVLLFILRKAPSPVSKEDIAKALKFSVSDTEDYLQYWVLMNVLEESEDGEEPAPKADTAPEKYVPKSRTAKGEEKKPEKPKAEIEYTRPSPSELAQRISESDELSEFFREIQLKMGKTISYDGQCTFLLLHDRFGLPSEVLFMLVDYCISIGKTGYSYIEKAGKDWSDKEIDTIEKAADKIASLKSASGFWNRFIKETGINNPKPTSTQLTYLETWVNEWNMGIELIVKAYEDMAEHTGKLSFPYMNKILEKWHAAGYKTLKDVEKAEKERTAKKSAAADGSAPSYNIDDFRNKSIESVPKYKRKKK